MTLSRRGLLGGLAATALWPRSGVALPRIRQTFGVEAMLLGNAQDAGVPQVNCFQGHCARVRSGEAPDPRVACLGLLDHRAGQRFLIDATPDFNAQVEALLASGGEKLTGRTVPLHEHLHGILLTHAHVGHYTGLAELGREIAAPRGLPLYVTPSMAAFLSGNAPWDAIVGNGNVELRELTFGQEFALTDRLHVTAYAVPHRAEYTDTVAYRVRGPERSLLYVPDADSWDGWPVPFETILDRCDLALLDGSFWSGAELGHRPQSEVPHPPVSLTIERLADRAGAPPVRFVHLNHTNPLWNPAAAERAALPQGFEVAETGERHAL